LHAGRRLANACAFLFTGFVKPLTKTGFHDPDLSILRHAICSEGRRYPDERAPGALRGVWT
jgi:hypothetical protein